MNHTDKKSWQTEVSEMLARAASVCAEHGVDMEAFMSGAFSAYFEAQPGLREQIETMQLIAQLQELRQAGRIATA